MTWRLLTEPDAPGVQVLRARYFANKDLLTDVLPATATFIWRSILQGLEIVKQHYIWAVGDGHQIQPWKHHWLTISPQPQLDQPQYSTLSHFTTTISSGTYDSFNFILPQQPSMKYRKSHYFLKP